MNSLFFYGTLRHVPLLSVVLGRDAEALDVVDAVLVDHEVFAVKNEVFPMIAAGGNGAKGILVFGLSDLDVERLRFYEGGFDYDLEPVQVQANGKTHDTRVFFPEPGLWERDGTWSLAGWVEAQGNWSVFGAIEEMSYFGSRSREVVDAMLPMIEARATAKVNARVNNLAHSPGGLDARDVTDVSMTRPYANYFTLEEYDLTFRRYDGRESEMVRRAVFVATDAVIVLPYDPVRDRVLLIEQFRPGPYARGDEKPWQLEPIAGRIDRNESALITAHREAREEAGLELSALEDVAHCYASPGCSTEYYNIYVGIADLPDGVVGVSGLEEEAEDIRSFLFRFEDLMDMVDRGQIVNAPLVLAALWLARHRNRLQEQVRGAT
ncbi:NUDIX domain-containing protein [Shimia abyssi]|uniref:Putative gamma-glutamylcyclotransferase n=1 Tax=Shimia abyssi TaxID=1662395 RepID=A0A2P8F6B3_9RHOB|nr:NUDIX domain-containing protein [Shimia abyssi]PSL17249.1 nudix-type nucleoside diphosphatase (YffH/AdpP family) [Shimia abyssi]